MADPRAIGLLNNPQATPPSAPSLAQFLYGLGNEMQAKAANPKGDVLDSYFQGQEQFKQNQQKLALQQQMQVPGALNDPAKRQQIAMALLNSSDPKWQELGSKLLTETSKFGSPLAVVDPKTGQQKYVQVDQAGNTRDIAGIQPPPTQSGRYAGKQAEEALIQEIQDSNPGFDRKKAMEATRAYLDSKDTLNDGTPFYVSGIAKGFASQFNLKSDTAQGTNQKRYALSLDNLMEEGNKYLPSIKNYVGVVGKVSNYADAIKSQYGTQSPEYGDYQYFTRQIVPMQAGEMMRTLGVNASDEQKRLYTSVNNPVNWDTNFDIASRNYERLTDLFRKTISPTVASGPASISRRIMQNAQQPAISQGMVLMTAPDNTQHYVPEANVQKAIDKYKFRKG